jgi:hypothetical protein
VKERPILFSGEMIRALLAGTKTQTRRVMKPQPVEIAPGHLEWKDRRGLEAAAPIKDAGWWFDCPYGHINDRLWVRETWMVEHFPSDGSQLIHYRADDTPAGSGWTAARMWKPSIHMPRAYSRITLEITDVRVERLQDISVVDAEAEGVGSYTRARGVLSAMPPDPRWRFVELWNAINGPRGYGWETNPFVWVLEFKRVKP